MSGLRNSLKYNLNALNVLNARGDQQWPTAGGGFTVNLHTFPSCPECVILKH